MTATTGNHPFKFLTLIPPGLIELIALNLKQNLKKENTMSQDLHFTRIFICFLWDGFISIASRKHLRPPSALMIQMGVKIRIRKRYEFNAGGKDE